MKYVFVGDIHGKVEQVKRALDMDGKKIFVGDFIDSWNRTIQEHDQCFELVIAAIRAGEAEATLGNHELSYIPVQGEANTPYHRCSGFDYQRSIIMRKHEIDIRELFKPYIMINPRFLVTHAGLTKQIWDDYNLTFDNLPQTLDQWWLTPHSPAHWIGYARGGRNQCGGIFWCDFNREFDPIPDLIQVFGHTAGDGIRVINNSYCIDTLDKQHAFLEMEL
jgi:hypothetical protein